MNHRWLTGCALATIVLLGASGCYTPPVPEDIESLYVQEGQGLGHRFLGEAASTYYVGIGDGIVIQVAGAPELSGPYIVGMDGKITLPFVEDVYVGGLTRKEIADKVKNTLERLYRDVEVTVTVAAYNSKRIYVFGEAMRIGALPFTGDMTMADVIATVGMNPITAKSTVWLIRSDPVKPRIYICRTQEVLYRGNSQTNYQVREDDIIYIRANIFGKIGKVVAKIMYPVGIVTSAIWTGVGLYTLPYQVDLQQEYMRDGRRY